MNRTIRPIRSTVLAFATCLLLAIVAHATTLTEVTSEATGLQADFKALYDTCDADPESWPSHVADFEELETERVALHADRSAIPDPCPCVHLDALIADIDAIAASFPEPTEGWGTN